MDDNRVVPLEDVVESDVESCGGKAVSLGKLIRLGARVPPGFCIVGQALDHLLDANGLTTRISEIASRFDFEDFAKIETETAEIRGLIERARIPALLERDIVDRYESLSANGSKYVAVRSSVAVRETSVSSFPGMMDTYHYVLGAEDVLGRVRECWASLWSARAAYLRHHKRIPHHKAVIAPVVQVMVNPDTAGVLFTANPVSKNTGEVVIEANWGLGESVVSGKSMNDYYIVDKATRVIRDRKIALKTVMVVMDNAKGHDRLELPVPPERAKVATLSDAQLFELTDIAQTIEDHYGFNVDVEWAYQTKDLYILQARRIPGLD